MRHYELTYIASPKLSEEEFGNLSERINGFLQEEAGVLEEISKPLRKEIGYLMSLNFSLNPEKLEILEKKLKAEGKILRYLILTKKVKEEFTEKTPPLFLEKRGVKTPSPMFEKKAKPKKVELKDIDKKIEEILKE